VAVTIEAFQEVPEKISSVLKPPSMERDSQKGSLSAGRADETDRHAGAAGRTADPNSFACL
jgi:hypothetical protein